MDEDARLYIARAEHHARLGQLGPAADAFEVALRFEADSMKALLGLTRVYLRQSELEGARRTLSRAIAVDEEHPEVLQLQAELHAKNGRFDLFVKSIHEAAEAELDRAKRRF